MVEMLSKVSPSTSASKVRPYDARRDPRRSYLKQPPRATQPDLLVLSTLGKCTTYLTTLCRKSE